MSFAIDRHREIRAMALGGQCADGLALHQVDTLDLPSVRHVDKGQRAAFIELETLRMRLEPDIGDLRPALWIYNGERALAITYEYPLPGIVDSDVIGIIAEINPRHERQVFRSQYPHRSIPSVRDVDRIGRRFVGDALGLLCAEHSALHLACSEVDDANGVVTQFGNEQPLALEVDGEMVDTTGDRPQRDFCLQLQGCSRRLGSPADRQCDHRRDQHRANRHPYPLAIATCDSAALSPCASFPASSFAQKCMKKRRGWSSSMWLCNAVTSMPLSRNAFMTGATSLVVSTKSPVIAALPPPVG